MDDAERAVAMEKLKKAQAELVRMQSELDEVNAAIAKAEEAGACPALARWYERQAALLHRQAEVADHVAALAAVLWNQNGSPLRIVH